MSYVMINIDSAQKLFDFIAKRLDAAATIVTHGLLRHQETPFLGQQSCVAETFAEAPSSGCWQMRNPMEERGKPSRFAMVPGLISLTPTNLGSGNRRGNPQPSNRIRNQHLC